MATVTSVTVSHALMRKLKHYHLCQIIVASELQNMGGKNENVNTALTTVVRSAFALSANGFRIVLP